MGGDLCTPENRIATLEEREQANQGRAVFSDKKKPAPKKTCSEGSKNDRPGQGGNFPRASVWSKVPSDGITTVGGQGSDGWPGEKWSREKKAGKGNPIIH